MTIAKRCSLIRQKRIQENRVCMFDIIEAKNVAQWRRRREAISKYYFDAYSDLAIKRAHIVDQLQESLKNNCFKNFSFSVWYVCVTPRYKLNHLSASGSINSVGGRFNIGLDIDKLNFPTFPALYLAENKESIILEKFGLLDEEKRDDFPPPTILNQPIIHSLTSVKGEMDTVLDLTKKETLRDYFLLVNNLKLSAEISNNAKDLGLNHPKPLGSLTELKASIMNPNWKMFPMQYDVPSPSQTLGQIAFNAGISAILYRPERGVKKCLAIFTSNLKNSSSWIWPTNNIKSFKRYKT